MQFKKQRWIDAQFWTARQGSGEHVAAYENQIQASFLPKELHKVSVSKVFETTSSQPQKVNGFGFRQTNPMWGKEESHKKEGGLGNYTIPTRSPV